jgi:cellulose synthase/poly-beta-1,6-N-acetylglucosamine synthase-like glycosyltransferase
VIAVIVALAALGVLLLAWVVYPLAMRLRPPARLEPVSTGEPPRVAIVIATRDAPAEVRVRIADLERSDYPAALRRIIVAADCRAPTPVEAYRVELAGLATVVAGDPPGGKAVTLNAGVREAGDADIIVFADTGQRFDPSAISRMVTYLDDPRFGGVTGRYTQHRNDGLMAAYAALEAAVRAGQAAGHSVISASGSIYALRTGFWRPLSAGLICDDLFTTLSIVRQGRRVGFCAEALAFDPRIFTRQQQFVRRVRTLTGLIQFCALQPAVLLPWRNPIWLHFVLHKLVRLATPVLLGIALVALLYAGLAAAPLQVLIALGGLAVLSLLVQLALPARVRSQLGWVISLQLVPVVAIANGLRRRWEVWGPEEQGRAQVVPQREWKRT